MNAEATLKANTAIPKSNSASEMSTLLKSAGDALRLQILSVLSKNAFGVSELSQIFAVKQNAMSHHLKTLSKSGLLTTRREGNTIFYRRSDEPLEALFEQMRTAIFTAADQIALDKNIEQQLHELFEQRAKSAQQFFIDNATAFKQQQDLIAEFSTYGPEVEKMLLQNPLPHRTHALEIGPGSGDFLPVLSQHFESVTALELSESMLEQSQQHCRALQCENVDFVLGDTRVYRDKKLSTDCAVLNMVLHHTPAPVHIFEDLSHIVKSGGTLMVCELSQHDQDWVRDACGDQWLGFASNELKSWAESYQFRHATERYLALRNGFQIQIHQFIKQ